MFLVAGCGRAIYNTHTHINIEQLDSVKHYRDECRLRVVASSSK